MVHSIVQLRIQPQARKQQPKPGLKVKACVDPKVAETLQRNIDDKLSQVPESEPTSMLDTHALTEEWHAISASILDALEATLGCCAKKDQDWFDENDASIRELLQAKNEAHAALLRPPSNYVLRIKWSELQSKTRKELRWMQNEWWINKVRQIQQYSDSNEMQKFYEAIKTVHDPTHHATHPVRSTDGKTLIKDRHGILNR